MDLGRTIGIILAVLLLIGAAVFFFFRYSFSSEGLYRVQSAIGMDAVPPERHVVPEGFRGWAVMHYGVDAAEPLRDDNGTLVVEYDASGSLETSTPAHQDQGFLHREYYERTPDGLRLLRRTGEIWGEYNMRIATDDGGVITGRSTGFFVGSMSEFRESERPRPGPELPELPSRFDSRD
jgi:hypothetical protein